MGRPGISIVAGIDLQMWAHEPGRPLIEWSEVTDAVASTSAR